MYTQCTRIQAQHGLNMASIINVHTSGHWAKQQLYSTVVTKKYIYNENFQIYGIPSEIVLPCIQQWVCIKDIHMYTSEDWPKHGFNNTCTHKWTLCQNNSYIVQLIITHACH